MEPSRQYSSLLLGRSSNGAQHLCRIAGHNRIGGHIVGNDAPGAHDGVLADDQVRKNGGPGPDGSPALDHRGFHPPVLLGLQLSPRSRCPRVGVVNEGYSVTDEDVVLDGHALANEGVTRDLAAMPDGGVFLDFDKRTNLCLIANLTSIQVDESGQLDISSEFYIGSDRAEFVHKRINSPFLRMDFSAASSIRTTRRPAWPSLKGTLLFMMHSAKYPISTCSASSCSSCGAHMSPLR